MNVHVPINSCDLYFIRSLRFTIIFFSDGPMNLIEEFFHSNICKFYIFFYGFNLVCIVGFHVTNQCLMKRDDKISPQLAMVIRSEMVVSLSLIILFDRRTWSFVFLNLFFFVYFLNAFEVIRVCFASFLFRFLGFDLFTATIGCFFGEKAVFECETTINFKFIEHYLSCRIGFILLHAKG